MTYKDYCKECLEKAKNNDWFDEDGNSVTSTVNRSFLKQMMLDVKNLIVDLVDVDFKEFLAYIIKILMLILSPVLFIPLLIVRAYFSRKRANKEMMSYYVKQRNK